jgi:hypothetical protein
MARKQQLVQEPTPRPVVPAWAAIDNLGYKASLYLASADKQRGVVLLRCPVRPSLIGVAWWRGSDWEDPAWLRAQVHWSTSPLSLLVWAAEHPTVSEFDTLLHLLTLQVQRTSN